ncbi:MAG: hypothetical protein HY554_04640 [Elusimicrobia bacterium]|nr:hypothetical protein [Elusimicrobiota bacterium]
MREPSPVEFVEAARGQAEGGEVPLTELLQIRQSVTEPTGDTAFSSEDLETPEEQAFLRFVRKHGINKAKAEKGKYLGEHKNPPWLNRLAWGLIAGLAAVSLAMLVSPLWS